MIDKHCARQIMTRHNAIGFLPHLERGHHYVVRAIDSHVDMAVLELCSASYVLLCLKINEFLSGCGETHVSQLLRDNIKHMVPRCAVALSQQNLRNQAQINGCCKCVTQCAAQTDE